MRVAYADPPYLNCCGLYEHYHPDGRCWDDPATHQLLIDRLCAEFPDGWALSLSAPSLATILAMCPADVRVAPWVKTWHQIRPRVAIQYAWEPVIFRGGRTRSNDPMVRDWLAAPATKLRGTPGAKPEVFSRWVLDLLGVEAEDEFIDLFPGSGAVSLEWQAWRSQLPLPFKVPPRSADRGAD